VNRSSSRLADTSLSLAKRSRFAITPSAPFYFDATFHKPSNFPAPMSAWEPGKYWQTIRVGSRLLGLHIKNAGTSAKPSIRVVVFHDGGFDPRDRNALRDEITWRFHLDADLREFDRRMRSDVRFAPVFRRWRGMRGSNPYTLYELLIFGVMLQNATVRRTVQMTEALLRRFGTQVAFDGKVLFAMWTPAELRSVSEPELRDLKVGYRAKMIKRLSDAFAAGEVDELALRAMDHESIRRELVKLYGVGPETARILLESAFHYQSAIGPIAPWEQKIYSRLFYKRRMVAASRIRGDLNRRYGEFAALAVGYIWEDVFWRRRHEHIAWLEKEIRL
jgi:3-methyladenine DNA glycosylase/8-oxoguanine DNA glycosylase